MEYPMPASDLQPASHYISIDLLSDLVQMPSQLVPDVSINRPHGAARLPCPAAQHARGWSVLVVRAGVFVAAR